MSSLPIEDYHVGIICALDSEMAAVEAMLDEEHEAIITRDIHDHNAYSLGRLQAHNVVVACLPAGVDGLMAAATVAKDMSRTFTQLRFGLLVGIGGGIPNLEQGIDIRLGDIVVSQPTGTTGGVVQYDKGKSKAEGEWERKGILNAPPTVLLNALQRLKARHLRKGSVVSSLVTNMLKQNPMMIENGYTFPGQDQDCLRCAVQSHVDDEAKNSAIVNHEAVPRPPRKTNDPKIHYGIIASGNQVVKDATTRDQIRRDCGAVCVEIEAAGLMDDFPCLVIRGICDYADTHKNDRWHRYAAAIAAAYAKELLLYVSAEETNHEEPIQQVLDNRNEQFQRQETYRQNDKQRDCHHTFKTTNYEEQKNINPKRAQGTCRWLLGHTKYQQWRENPGSDLLWISADPGCGKSVLSRSLVDQDLRSDGSGLNITVCYFFFKDNEVQDSLATALCAVLHQLFKHQPHLIRHAVPAWENDGSDIVSKVDELWRILQTLTNDQSAQPVVCVLDALDECRDTDRKRLISMLCQFYNDAARTPSADAKLKFLVTSRPYEDIEHHFGRIATSLPSIRLRGEEEYDQIREEIDLVVRQRVSEIATEFRLAPTVAERLKQKLLAMEHRTYLWLYLAMYSIYESFSQSLRPDEKSVELLPGSVDEAYEQILSKVDQEQTRQVRAILQIIVGVRRPLTIGEMALALDITTSKATPRSFSDLIIREDQLVLQIRQWCGLFVFINHSRLYLIHQTAKEFLLRDYGQTWINSGKWKHCLSTTDVEREIARLYILYLCLEDFEEEYPTIEYNSSNDVEHYDVLEDGVQHRENHKQNLFVLAAGSWADHWRSVEVTADENMKDKAWTLYSMQDQRFSRWTKVMWRTQRPYEHNPGMNNLMLAAYNGHVGILRRILNANLQSLEARDQRDHTALMRGVEMGYYGVSKLLLEAGANVNAQGGRYGSALQAASHEGHLEVAQLLIAHKAEFNAPGGVYGSALQAASHGGHLEVAHLLTASGADVNAQGGVYGSALQAASHGGHLEVAHLLTASGADVNAQGGRYGSALQAASHEGHLEVAHLLTASGADVNAQGGRYGSALQAASHEGHLEVAQLLIAHKADVNAQGGVYGSALQAALGEGHTEVARLLIAHKADVNARGGIYGSVLKAASYKGREEIVELLIASGADVNAYGGVYGTALQAALKGGCDRVARILIQKCPIISSQGDLHDNALQIIPDEDNQEQALLPDEHALDNDSDLTDVLSVESLPSLMSGSSSPSMPDEYSSKATEHLANLLLEDPLLLPMYKLAIAKFGHEKFHKNHDQLLKLFFNDLRSETQNYIQLDTVRGLRTRNRRREITLLVVTACEPRNVNKHQAMTILKDQKPDRKQLLDSYLEERISVLSIDRLTRLGGEVGRNNVAPFEQDGISEGEETDSSSSDDTNHEQLDQADRTKYKYLEPLEKFITRGTAFARFKTNFDYLLQPPNSLSEALQSRNLHIIHRFLARNFAFAATADFEWLHELDEAGYSKREIAELLLEDTNDSPWIFFVPRVCDDHRVQTSLHMPGCAHEANHNTKPKSSSYSEKVSPLPRLSYTDLRKQVEELCGIGGVVPTSKDTGSWHGSVTFEDQSSVSVITYATTFRQTRSSMMQRVSNVLTNFCTAAALLQSAGLCCNSFTALLSLRNYLELRQVKFEHAREMAANINLALQGVETKSAMQRCVQSAEYVLQELKPSIPEATPNSDLHYCALAAQFLCSALLSYFQAHIGPIDPFFLDTPQRKLILLGSHKSSKDFAISAELFNATCLADMAQQPLLAFSSGAARIKLVAEAETSRYDVLTNIEDCLDTWGPGYLIRDRVDTSKIHAIAIGDGFISLVDSKNSQYHWTRERLAESASLTGFESSVTMRIGAVIDINKNCSIDEVVCRENSSWALESLGTHRMFWEPQERQFGIQTGQYLVGNYVQAYKKIPGTTLKQRHLQQLDDDCQLIYFLEQNWGLQVSFCTSVARRVTLRELVTDLLPVFADPLKHEVWQKLISNHNVIQTFTNGDLFPWLRTLSDEGREHVFDRIRTILKQLQHTGFDRQSSTLVIAWPTIGETGRGVKIPCRAQTCWAQFIADAEDCATFAYITTKCLVTKDVPCRSTISWQNMSKVLITEISPSWPQEQYLPLVNTSTTTFYAPSSAATTIMVPRWKLKDKNVYCVQKLDCLLWVRVDRSVSTDNGVAHLSVLSSGAPRRLWKRLVLTEERRKNYRIRERQAKGDQAEYVIVKAEKNDAL